jgi:hypothetical protein
MDRVETGEYNTHTVRTRTREREQVLFDTRKAKKAMHSFYKNKNPGNGVFFKGKRMPKKEAARLESLLGIVL